MREQKWLQRPWDRSRYGFYTWKSRDAFRGAVPKRYSASVIEQRQAFWKTLQCSLHQFTAIDHPALHSLHRRRQVRLHYDSILRTKGCRDFSKEIVWLEKRTRADRLQHG
jgi:hypothetical protein